MHQGSPPAAKHLKNSYASETPVTDGQRVYACFGNVGIFCLDLDGRPVWSKPLPARRTRAGWGIAASPTLHRDRLYLVNDNDEKSELLASDAAMGKEVWRVDRDEKSNWSTPFVWENDQRTEIITLGSGKVRAYDLDGKLLWWLRGMSSITIATPYADAGLLYISSGCILDRNRPLYAIRPGASGDISLAPGRTSNAAIAWCGPTASSQPSGGVQGPASSCSKIETSFVLSDSLLIPFLPLIVVDGCRMSGSSISPPISTPRACSGRSAHCLLVGMTNPLTGRPESVFFQGNDLCPWAGPSLAFISLACWDPRSPVARGLRGPEGRATR